MAIFSAIFYVFFLLFLTPFPLFLAFLGWLFLAFFRLAKFWPSLDFRLVESRPRLGLELAGLDQDMHKSEKFKKWHVYSSESEPILDLQFDLPSTHNKLLLSTGNEQKNIFEFCSQTKLYLYFVSFPLVFQALWWFNVNSSVFRIADFGARSSFNLFLTERIVVLGFYRPHSIQLDTVHGSGKLYCSL